MDENTPEIPETHAKDPSKIKDLTGQIFHELTVLGWVEDSIWECRCSCGELVKVRANSLKTGNTKSCGHLKSNAGRKRIKPAPFEPFVQIAEFVTPEVDQALQTLIARMQHYGVSVESTRWFTGQDHIFPSSDRFHAITDALHKVVAPTGYISLRERNREYQRARAKAVAQKIQNAAATEALIAPPELPPAPQPPAPPEPYLYHDTSPDPSPDPYRNTVDESEHEDD